MSMTTSHSDPIRHATRRFPALRKAVLEAHGVEATSPPHRRPRHDEDNLHMACVQYFDFQYHRFRLLLHHSPNEGLLPKTQRDGAKRKKMGCRAGFPDLILLLPRHGFAYLAIELKTKKGWQSESQRLYQRAVEEAGGRYVLCRSVDEFRAVVDDYIKGGTATAENGYAQRT